MNCSKTVFLTGGTGLIGKELLAPLVAEGFAVYALSIEKDNPSVPNVTWIKGNLFDETFIKQIMAQIKPTHLLNMAWCAHGDYAFSNANFAFLRASLALLEAFALNGGKRAVCAGTFMEYEEKNAPIKEEDPVAPKTAYALCKNALRETAASFCSINNISFAWGRIFCVYGKNEHPKRLTASIINSLKAGDPVQINFAQLERDYMYSKDIAAAFTRLLDSDVQGTVNICTGKSIHLGDYARAVAKLLGREDLLVLKEENTSQPPLVVGDNRRLREEVGFTPSYTLQDALKEII